MLPSEYGAGERVRRSRARARRWRVVGGLAALLLLVIAVLLLTGLNGKKPESTPLATSTPKPGGTYNFPLSSDPVAIDPTMAFESQGTLVARQIFQGLTREGLDANGNITAEPAIAESWETTDNVTWIFHLKKGVSFQPPVSREVKAKDVVNSWTWVTSRKNESPVAYVLAPLVGCGDDGYLVSAKKGLTGVKALDDYTLEVKLRYPFADLPLLLLHTVASVQPVDYIKEVGVGSYRAKPVGTGPYLLAKWQRGTVVKLTRNPDYWDSSTAGYLDGVQLPITKSADEEWQKFQKGTLDCSRVPAGKVWSIKDNPKIKSGEWSAKGWPILAVDYIAFNMKDQVVGGEQGLKLRKALQGAIDVPRLIDALYEGQATAATGMTPKGAPGWVADLNPLHPNDPGGAKAAISELDPPALKYWYNTDESNQKMAEIIRGSWRTAGAEVKLTNYEWGAFLAKIAKGKGQIYRQSWISDVPSPDNFLAPLFESKQPSSLNTSFYRKKEFDALLHKARATTDQKERFAIYHEAEAMLLSDAVVIPLVYPQDYRVTSNRIGGFTLSPTGLVPMWKLWVN